MDRDRRSVPWLLDRVMWCVEVYMGCGCGRGRLDILD